ncbi:MAG TPA: glycine hydroxymethyltransferase [Magnetospirillum sp.]|nr:glycine hydroxymethyltransferase [Magnetospirillum sp.]
MPQDRASRLSAYLRQLGGRDPHVGAAAYYASVDQVAAVSPTVADAIVEELRAQRSNLKLIASENYCSLATQLAQGNLLTDKYAEGVAGKRFYAGCDNVDAVEREACDLARQLFQADHAYVQPHSGVDANLTALFAILFAKVRAPFLDRLAARRPEDVSREDWLRLGQEMGRQRLLGMDYYSGGHLTHGYRLNAVSHVLDCYSYTVDPETHRLDMNALWRQVREIRPLILLAGYSAYPRRIDFAALRQMADEVGAVLWVDMAHFAGLVAGGVFQGDYDPVTHADIVTTTTHKTLRGPRGGLVLCRQPYAEWVDKGCPTNLGGPLPHVMAAKAVAFREALRPEFRDYAHQVVNNSRALAEECLARKLPVLTGGSDNHLVLVDVWKSFGLTGRQAESALRSCGLTVNRNALPFDPQGAWFTSGLRLGTAAAATLGMGTQEMREIADVVSLVLANARPAEGAEGASRGKVMVDSRVAEQARNRVGSLLARHPLYPEIDLDILSGGLPT